MSVLADLRRRGITLEVYRHMTETFTYTPFPVGNLHILKTRTPYFKEVLNGYKRVELRKNDRDFRVGDILRLREYNPESGFTGRETYVQVVHIVNDETYLQLGFVALSIYPVTVDRK